jgi:two-component system, cell cycle response regulator DivK
MRSRLDVAATKTFEEHLRPYDRHPLAITIRSPERLTGMTGERETILVIDAAAANLELARVRLEREGYQVETATDAVSAFEVLKESRPALIVTNVQLPGLDGWELTRRLKTNFVTRHIPVVAVTPYMMRGDEARAKAVGCDDYVPKPITTEELPAIVSRSLKRDGFRR